MTLTKEEILTSLRLPARLDAATTALLLNFAEHDIAVLIKARVLEPLGSPAANAPKYFARRTIEEVAADPAWLSKATKAVSQYWRKKRIKGQSDPGRENLTLTKKAKNASIDSPTKFPKTSISEQ